METQRGFADVNGTRLYYEVAGQGAPLVLRHGFTLDTRMWDDQFAVFARRYRVIRYDGRGFGRSALPVEGEPYTHEDDLAALLTHLGVARAHVLGMSGGGSTVTYFAHTRPAATASLILAGSALDGFPTPPAAAAATPPTEDARRAAQAEGPDAGRAAWLRELYFVPALEQPAVAARLREIVAGWSVWQYLHEDPKRPPAPPAVQRLGEIRAPTLVLIGERDTPRLLAVADALAAGIPNVRKVVLPGVGHMANMEAPGPFNDAVLAFLAEVTP
jgi:pimeloyl-ACP methyl ester carboxylesterase